VRAVNRGTRAEQRSLKSKQFYSRAIEVTPGGVHSQYRYIEPNPRYFARGKGAYLWDVDGNKYVDCCLNNGSCILGHGFPEVVEAVRRQLGTGLTVGVESELTIKTAKLLNEMIPSAEFVKFANTGTEAVMHAIQIARGVTGKKKIAKLEGGYNGWYDYVQVSTHPNLQVAGPASQPTSVTNSDGLGKGADETIVIPFNDVENSTRIIRDNRNELAAVLLEPVMFNVGCVAPVDGFLPAIRDLTRTLGIPLIFDEVVTGFHFTPGGAQKYYDVTPDISTFGKAIANGFPLAAVVGKREFMKVSDPKTGAVSYLGTYNGTQMSLAAAYATLKILRSGRVQERFREATKWLLDEFKTISSEVGIEAKLNAIAGKFQIYFAHDCPINYRTALLADSRKYKAFQREVVKAGVLFHASEFGMHGISYSHLKSDLKLMVQAMKAGLREAKSA
jgi:glutamate-1-semialdehyde 2,1-aminomutase